MKLSRPGIWVGVGIGFIFLAVAFVEHSMGRIWICKCGTVELWYPYTNGPGNSQQLSDWYSFTHIIHGFVIYALLRLLFRNLPVHVRLILTVLIEGVWEVFENSSFIINRYRAETISLDYYGDSVINSLSDIVFCMFGFFLAYKFPVKVSITTVIALEIILGFLVHDNLTLNLVQLAVPSEAIKEWQASPSPIPSSP